MRRGKMQRDKRRGSDQIRWGQVRSGQMRSDQIRWGQRTSGQVSPFVNLTFPRCDENIKEKNFDLIDKSEVKRRGEERRGEERRDKRINWVGVELVWGVGFDGKIYFKVNYKKENICNATECIYWLIICLSPCLHFCSVFFCFILFHILSFLFVQSCASVLCCVVLCCVVFFLFFLFFLSTLYLLSSYYFTLLYFYYCYCYCYLCMILLDKIGRVLIKYSTSICKLL